MKGRGVLFKGSPLTLAGRTVRTGDAAPEFRATTKDLKEARLADFRGKVKVITSFPSLDTPVCDLQVKEFNARAAGLGGGVAVVGISKDLPFAQQRFCETFEITNVQLLSDYLHSSFGLNYGLLVKELNLLARAVLIVDAGDVLRYLQIVGEIASPPDYDEALGALGEVLRSPGEPSKAAPALRCAPCEGGARPLPPEEAASLAAGMPGWGLGEGGRLVRDYAFGDYRDAAYFVGLAAALAEEQGHHPVLTLSWRRVAVSLTTHAAGGLTRNDFTMAALLDQLL
jgi:thiol peroxidase